MQKSRVAFALVGSIMLASPCGFAQDAPGEVYGAPIGSAEGDVGPQSLGRPGWLARYAPEPLSAELGVVYGMLFPSTDHNFHDEARPQQAVNPASPDFGLRGGYYPLGFVGGEVEGVLAPTSTDDGVGATLWAVRSHLVAQLPISRISPFLLFGGGYMGLLSNPNGNDGDPLLHYGGGVRFGLNDVMVARVDLRDNLTQSNNAELGSLTHHPEVLVGLAVRFYSRSSRAAADGAQPRDHDGDGFVGAADACPHQSGAAPDGCPEPDADSDGFPDRTDKCPQTAGQPPHGCPTTDRDQDGFFDYLDKCPDQAGVSPDGCAPRDDDEDAVPNHLDQCPGRPETPNGYKDEDGCPDELPEAISQITGTLEGLEFEPETAVIVPDSAGVLDRAAAALKAERWAYVLITVHTDNAGERAAKVALSEQRAETVKGYLIARGVEASRIQTRGAGPDEPLVGNDTEEGRRKNQRVELYVIAAPVGDTGPEEIEPLTGPSF